MKIPLDWLNEYVDTSKLSPAQIADTFTAIGLMLDKPLANNVLDLEHRFDRSDWLSIIGCARDFAAYQNLPLKLPKRYTEKGKPATPETLVKIVVECPRLVRRFNTRVFKNITVKDSPDWLKNRLEAYGMPSINNIVDITNYVMIEYGQTLHAQDLAKFDPKDKSLVIRNASKNEKITTLDGTTVGMDESMFVLANAGEAVVIGGIVGGIKTAVTESTTDIILDSGNYNQTNIRQTSRKLKIQNESSSRNDKFLHPHATQVAIERATQLILDLAGGEFYENEDYYPNPQTQRQMTLTTERLKMVGDMDLDLKTIKRILAALEYKLLDEKNLVVELPYFRTDIEVEDDIVSDILRIHGYSNIPTALISTAPPREITPKIHDFEEKLRDILVNLGLHEHITNALVFSGEHKTKTQVILENSLNAENDAMREDIYSTLLPVVENYKKFGVDSFGVFEIGKVYTLNGAKSKHESYTETRVLEAVFCDISLNVAELNKKVKQVLAGLFKGLGIEDMDYERGQGGDANILYDGVVVGHIKHDSFTLFTEKLLTIPTKALRISNDIQHLSKEDISLVISTKQPFGPIYTYIKNYDQNIKEVEVVDEYLDERLGSDKKAVLVRVSMGASVEIKDLIKELEEKFEVSVRK